MISCSANRSLACGAMALSNLRSGMNRIGLSARSAQGSRRQATRTEHIVVPYHYPIFTGVYDGQSTKAQQSGNSKTQGRKDQVFSRAGGLADHGCFDARRSEEHTSELPSLMSISYSVFCLKKKKTT